MTRPALIPTVRIALALAFLACLLGAAEMGWRMFAMQEFLALSASMAPATAEELSNVTAPMLRAASNAEPLFGVVKSQHLALHQKHELLIELARTQWSSAFFGLLTSAAGALLTLGAFLSLAKALPQTNGTQGVSR